MKRMIVCAFGLVFLGIGVSFAGEVNLESSISAVSVYPDQALITRQAKVTLKEGLQKLIFADIIPELDDNSVRVAARGSADVRLFGAQVKRNYIEISPSEKIRELEDKIQSVYDQMRKLSDQKSLTLEEKGFLDSLRQFGSCQLPKELATKMPQAADLDALMKFLDARLKENYSRVMDSDTQSRELTKKMEALKKELEEVRGRPNRTKRDIVVEAEVRKPGNLVIEVSYLVPQATWRPLYDARADFSRGEVELSSYGVVSQRTGEDWQDVEFALSTARPSVGGAMPEVQPWFLRPYELQAGRRLRAYKTDALGAAMEMASRSDMPASAPVQELAKEKKAEVVYAQAVEGVTSLVYKLERKSTVKADGSEYRLPVSHQALKCDFEYSSFPKVAPYAYLRSRVTNSPESQLLPGQANVFLNGDFVGSAKLGAVSPGEEFDLYLGVDDNVKVKREELSKKVDDVLIAGIPAPNRKVTFQYKLSVENYKHKRIRAVLFEPTPVSQDERIKVKILNVSLAPQDKDWKDKKGVWRWELELEPKAKKEIVYSYSVEYPRDMSVEGL